MAESKNKSSWCALIPLRQLVALPGTSIVLDIGRELSKIAVNEAQEDDGRVLLFTQIRADDEQPTMDDLYPVGVFGRVIKVEENPSIRGYKITVEVECRAQLTQLDFDADYMRGQYYVLSDAYSSEVAKDLVPALESKVTGELNKFNRLTKKLNANQLTAIHN